MTDNSRSILHMDLDSFFVSVERLKDPSLNGKPVIVGGVGARGVVSSCSYEARQFGVHSAMPGGQAHKLCPHGIFLPGDHAAYSKYSRIVTEIIADSAPLFEKASVDEFYVDLTGMDKYFGAYKWSTGLREKIIKETGLPISFGLSINKMLAKMATNDAKPNGQLMIERGKEQEFLDPKPVGKIPFVGEKLEETLNKMGIRTIYDLRQMPIENLINIFSKTGTSLWNRSRGHSDSPVANYREEKSISVERTFDTDTTDVEFLLSALFVLTEKLSYDLRKLNRLTSCITVKIRYEGFITTSRQHTVDYSLSSKYLIEKATELFHQSYEKGRPVRLIGIRFSGLVYSGTQYTLFDDKEEENSLYSAIDTVKNKYGTNKLILARGIDLGNVKRNRDVQAMMKEQVNRERSNRDDKE
ncbi:MAG: polymerase [Bacteroidetes bacterium]|nr:polymerase [Bacteroidota bacterium]